MSTVDRNENDVRRIDIFWPPYYFIHAYTVYGYGPSLWNITHFTMQQMRILLCASHGGPPHNIRRDDRRCVQYNNNATVGNHNTAGWGCGNKVTAAVYTQYYRLHNLFIERRPPLLIGNLIFLSPGRNPIPENEIDPHEARSFRCRYMSLCTADDDIKTRRGWRRYIRNSGRIPWRPTGTYLPTTRGIPTLCAMDEHRRFPVTGAFRNPRGYQIPMRATPRQAGATSRPALFFQCLVHSLHTVHTSATVHGYDNNIIFIIIRHTHNL